MNERVVKSISWTRIYVVLECVYGEKIAIKYFAHKKLTEAFRKIVNT